MELSKWNFKQSYIGRRCAYDYPVTVYGMDTGARIKGNGTIADTCVMASDSGGTFMIIIDTDSNEKVYAHPHNVTLTKRFGIF